MRRRPLRVGEQPKTKGAPTFLLITLFRTVYLSLFVWQNVAESVKHDIGPFTWHIAGVLLFGFSSGLYKGSARLQLRGTRNDAFLEPLPLTTLARSGLQLSDSLSFVPMIVAVPLAALSVHGELALWTVWPVLLSVVAFVACFAVGLASIAWARALGPPAAGRWGSYLGVALNTVSLAVIIVGLGRSWRIASHERLTHLASLWLAPHASLFALYAASLALGALGYGALFAAERYGFDQLDAPGRAPKPGKRTRDRVGLERVMMLRQGGRPLFIVFSLLVLGAAWVLVRRAFGRLPESDLLTVTTFVVYLGALQIIGQAGRAARGDLMARSFLAALPMSPHQVLDGKTQALRMLQIPVHLLLILLGVFCTWHFGLRYAYRSLLAVLSLHVVVEGAISVAFLSNDIGVVGVSGTQSGSDFSTTLLMLPLLATVMAPNAWSATTAFIAVIAVSWESRRAARMSVRWIDDPADDLERETTVWRALLAATAFFAVQAVSYRMLSVFDLPTGYGLAIAFAASGLLLALLTWRNHTRIERPRFLPRQLWYWPLGVLLGAASGALALLIAKLVPPIEDGAMSLPDFSGGELIAMSITMTVVAPLAEEYFFRGWLQRAIALDLPADKKRWAFVIGAAVFALAHFGTYGVPQLVLGLLAGWLYASGGGLWPGILAHAAHNGVVLLLGR